jgi:tetratricopeptide (TPR) repeat protein
LKLRHIIKLITLAFLLTGCFVNPDNIYLKAVRYINEGKLDYAEKLLFSVLEYKKDFPDVYYSLGVVYLKQERYNLAIDNFQKVLQYNPDDLDTLVNLGVIHARLNKLKEAEAFYTRAVTKHPNNNTILLNLARLLFKQNKLREARLLYEKILRTQPNLYSAIKELAYILKTEGKLSDSIEQFSKAVTLKPQDSEALFELGSLHFGKGRLKTASKFFMKAVSVEPKAKYFLALGHLYEGSGEKSDAIIAFEKAYALDKSSFDATFRLGVLSLQQMELKKAEQYLKNAIALRPKSAEVQKYLGVLFFHYKQDDNAIDAFAKAKELNPYVLEIYYYLGLIALRRNEPDKASTFFNREITEYPGNARAYVELAKIYLDQGNYKEGEKLAKLAMKHHRDLPELWELRGRLSLKKAEEDKEKSGLYVALESYDAAIQALKKAYNLKPASPVKVLEYLIEAFDGAKRFGAAVPYLEKMIEFKPDESKYHKILASGYVAMQSYDKGIEAIRRYLAKNESDVDAWFELGKIYADKGDFREGIEVFEKVIKMDDEDATKKMFLGMLLAEVNRFEDALKVLKQAVVQAGDNTKLRRRCEDLIQQIVDASGISEKKVAENVGSEIQQRVKKQSGRKKLVPGSKAYVKAMLYRGLKKFGQYKRAGWTSERKRQMLAIIKQKLIANYRKLIQYKKFQDRTTQRYYYLGIKKLILMLKQSPNKK